jgi:hypothetical protein
MRQRYMRDSMLINGDEIQDKRYFIYSSKNVKEVKRNVEIF